MDKRKRLARLPPRPAPVAFDFETSALSGAQWTPEQMKMMMTKDGKPRIMYMDFARTEQRAIGPAPVRVIMDEISYFAADDKLTLDEWRWSKAFHEVMGVNDRFYNSKTPEQRRAIEAAVEERAKHNNLRGRTAARVVAYRAEMVLSEKKRAVDTLHDDLIRSKIENKQAFLDALTYDMSMTGRTKK